MNKDFKKGSILDFSKRLGTIIVLGNLEHFDDVLRFFVFLQRHFFCMPYI